MPPFRHSLLTRQLKIRPVYDLRFRSDGARVHPDLHRFLDTKRDQGRELYSMRGDGPGEFRGAALGELLELGKVWRIEAKVYLPVFVPPEYHRICRSDGGSPIWLPRPELANVSDKFWRGLAKRLHQPKPVW